MAKIVEINMKEHDSGLYDSNTGEICKTEKVVDISEDCPTTRNGLRAILLFTRVKRGRIVQISQPFEGKMYMGIHIHFLVDKLDREMRVAPRDDTFGSTAIRLGLTKERLRSLIEEHAPA